MYRLQVRAADRAGQTTQDTLVLAVRQSPLARTVTHQFRLVLSLARYHTVQCAVCCNSVLQPRPVGTPRRLEVLPAGRVGAAGGGPRPRGRHRAGAAAGPGTGGLLLLSPI